MSGNSILPASDRRSPFYINVPPHDAKPITYLISYFKLWKHFVASLIVYLKDLVKAKEFELNLNLQLIGSIQFPGFKDLPYKCLSSMEQQLPSPTTTQTSTPKNEPNASGAQQAAGLSKDANRPNLPKTKSSSSFLKNLSFAHRKTGSLSNLVPEGSATSVSSHHKQPANTKVSGSKTNAPQTTSSSILAAKLAPKSDVTIDSTFFPPDSLFTNMGSSLVKDHFSTYSAQAKLCREITHKLLPKLESLHKNIGVKIKEIKTSLKNESFANATLIKEVSKTGNCLTNFVNSVNRYSSPQPVIRRNDTEDEDEAVSLNDPFLVKLDLDYQIKNQLIHENYIFALYVNLQTISKDLFNYVVKDLHSVTEKLIKSLTSEAVYATTLENCLFNLGATLKGKLKSLDYDWQYFMVHNPNFLNVYYNDEKSPKKETRTFKDIVIPYSNSVHSKCLRCGYLHKKQKVMKSYVSHFYLLTCNYLHEFKVENHTEKAQKNESSNSSIRKKAKGKIGGVVDHESTPVKSYNLNDYSIQVRNEKEFKFVLTKTSNSSQKFTFKCQNETDFKAWSTDLHDLLKFSSQHIKRFNFIEAKMAHRDLESAGTKNAKNEPLSQNTSQSSLNLGKLLPGDASLDKIQSSSLTGMFTPKIESPSNQNQNPFEAGFEQSLPLGGTPLENTNFVSSEHGSESPHAHSPLNSNSRAESPVDHQSEHEHYLRLQNEIMLQQEQLLLLGSAGGDRPSMSRHSSTESILSVMEQNNHNLSQFLNKNQDFMRDFGEHLPSDGSIALVPSVHVLHHETD